MRLGAPVYGSFQDPQDWVQAVRAKGYRAAYCPLKADVGSDVIRAFERAANAADIVIAEVGAWSNPLDPDESKAKQALAFCQQQLALADEIGARCCVNIAGSRGSKWDGPDPADLTSETFERIVTLVRELSDVVQPKRAV